MTNSKKILLALVLACIGFSVFAKDPEIFVVVRVSLTQKIDPFYARTFEGDPQAADLVFPDTWLGFVNSRSATTWCKKSGEFFLANYIYSKKDGRLEISGFHYLPYGVFNAYLRLPFAKEITIPEGARYVYVGSLEYDIDPKTFQVKSVTIHDEYEAAQAAVNKITGKEIQLVRAPIKDIPAK